MKHALAFVGVAALWSALVGAEEGTYRNPIIFERAHVEPATGTIIHGAKLWVMEQDGTNARQLTFGDTYDDHPSLFSDQRHVLYSEFPRDGFTACRLVHVDNRPVYLSGEMSSAQQTDWCDAAWLSGPDKPKAKLFKLDIYTGEREIFTEDEECDLHHATVSPIGDRVVYIRDCGLRKASWVGGGTGAYEISMAAANGIALADSIIFQNEKNPYELLGQRLAEIPSREVALVRLYGTGKGARALLVTSDKHLNRRPAVSPDGDWMAWQTNMNGTDDEIFIARVDGSDTRNLTRTAGDDGHPWFSRDGRSIVFESIRSGNWEIWTIDIETAEQRQLTDGQGTLQSRKARM